MLIYIMGIVYIWLRLYFLDLAAQCFSVIQFKIITHFHNGSEGGIEKRPVVEPEWAPCQGFSLL